MCASSKTASDTWGMDCTSSSTVFFCWQPMLVSTGRAQLLEGYEDKSAPRVDPCIPLVSSECRGGLLLLTWVVTHERACDPSWSEAPACASGCCFASEVRNGVTGSIGPMSQVHWFPVQGCADS
eukprot:3165795-Amphidinium_carterae.1